MTLRAFILVKIDANLVHKLIKYAKMDNCDLGDSGVTIVLASRG